MTICLMLFSGCTCSKQSPLKAYRYTPPPPPPPSQEVWTWTKLACEANGAEAIAVDPSNQATVYVSQQKIWRSTDGGTTFSVLWDSSGFGLTVDPRNSNVIYVGRGIKGLWRTTDGGSNWELLCTCVPADYGLAVDHFNSDIIYAQAWRSTDRGATWQLFVPPVRTPIEVTSIAQSYQNPNVIYAGLCDGAGSRWIKKTTDGGGTWNIIADWLNIWPILVSPINDQQVFAIMQRGGWDTVATSKDGGATWGGHLRGLDSVMTLNGFAIDFRQEPRVYVGAINVVPGADPSALGVYSSTDGGLTWKQIGLQGKLIGPIATDQLSPPESPAIYVTVYHEGIYKGQLTKTGGTK